MRIHSNAHPGDSGYISHRTTTNQRSLAVTKLQRHQSLAGGDGCGLQILPTLASTWSSNFQLLERLAAQPVGSESAAHLKTGKQKHHSPPLPSYNLHLFERNRPSWQKRTTAAATRAARQWTVADASRATFLKWLSGSRPHNQRSYCKTTAPLCREPNFRRPCRRSRHRRPLSKYRRAAQSASDRFRPHGQGHLLSRQAPGRTLIAQIRNLSALVIFEH